MRIAEKYSHLNGMESLMVPISPMKELQSQMSSGAAYFEGEFYNVVRNGRGVPAVPLVLIGIAA